MTGPHIRRARGALEASVLRALWDLDDWATPRRVQSEVPGTLAYSTIVTVLRRLHGKGDVERRAVGRGHEYRPVESAEERTARAMADILRLADDPAAALNHFVEWS